MQQKQWYLDDTYLHSMVTTVVRRGEYEGRPWVALQDNIFHPQGGGQPADVGTVESLTAHPRRDTVHPSMIVLHLPDAEPDVLAGVPEVRSVIDLAVRRRHAALHTAGHLVNAIMVRDGFHHAGNNHFPGQARVEYDVAGQPFDAEALRERLIEGIDRALRAQVPVTAGHADDGRRMITIEGMGSEACGGTHVPNLGYLSDVAIRSLKVKGGRLRVGYVAEHADTL